MDCSKMTRTHMLSGSRIRLRAAASVAFAMFALALSALANAQAKARESFLTVQQQVEALKPNLIRATVALNRRGGSGSGVIISPDGYVLTAAHVIAGGRVKTCRVLLSDGRTLEGNILGLNRDDDYGLVKIDGADNLPYVPLGDSSTLRRGEWVLAMGHPLGPHTGRPPVLRIGRVLWLPRDPDKREANAIVSDAPIINGDSGGPLFDLTGRVVGIHSMILSGDRRMSSIHVPVNEAKDVLGILKKGENPSDEDGARAPIRAAISEAQDALRANDLDGAVKAAQHASEIEPTSARAQLVLAQASARRGKANQALAALDKACDLGFNDPDALKHDSNLASLSGRPEMKKLLERLSAVSGIPGGQKSDMSVLTAASAVERNLDRGVVRIKSGDTEVALGTVMSADGDILTKASELPEGTLTCVLPDGHKVSVERRAVSPEWDVALLKADAPALQILPMADSEVGKWTFSPDASGGVAAVGMVSVAAMPVTGKGISGGPTSKAYLGVQLDEPPIEALKQIGLDHGVAVIVTPGYPAERAGLRTGDVILAADGQTIRTADGFMDYMVKKKPGDSLKLSVAREDERLTIDVDLAERPADLPGRGGMLAQLSGEISHMQGPFPKVMQHDARLRPSAMGGPLLDLNGDCIGLNIARADREATYAIAAKDMKDIYAKLKQNK